jgi:hypothetical protein
MQIFLLEDNQSVAETLMWWLGKQGHKVMWAQNIKEGEFLLGARDFDAGIFDLQVHEHYGTELLPVNFAACMFSGLPDEAEAQMKRDGIFGVPAFSKSDLDSLQDWLERVAKYA